MVGVFGLNFSLAAEELAQIPGSGVLKSADSLPLQVLVRDGVNVVVHPDYVRKWSNCGGELGQQQLAFGPPSYYFAIETLNPQTLCDKYSFVVE